MITRIIYTEIWNDNFFMELSPEEKLLFIYYLTNDRVNIIHLYQCSNARTTADTGIDTPIIKEAKKKFETAGKIYFKENYVFLKNANKYETYRGPQNETAKQKLFNRLSENIIAWYNKITDTPIYTPIDRDEKQETISKKSYTINKMNERVNPDDVPI